MVNGVCAESDCVRQGCGLLPTHEWKNGSFVVGLAGPVILASTIAGDEEDGGGKVVFGEDRDGVVDEVGEAVVEGDGDGVGMGEDLIEGYDGDG